MKLSMAFGYIVDRANLASRAIMAATDGPFHHCLAMFHRTAEAGEDTVYFESLFKTNSYGKGVRGPIPLANIQDWVSKHPETRHFERQPAMGWLPLTVTEVDTAWDILQSAVDEGIGYDPGQILRNLLATTIGVCVLSRRGSSDKAWTCSETLLRALPPRCWPYFGIPNHAADFVVPSGTRLPSIWEGTNDWLKDEGGAGVWRAT